MVQTDAMVVISLTTTCAGGVPRAPPGTPSPYCRRALVDRGDAAFGDEIEAFARPGVWSTERKAAVVVGLDLRQPLGHPALAAHRLTVEFATAPPPAWTCPSTRTAAPAAPDAKPIAPNTPAASALRIADLLLLCSFRIPSKFEWLFGTGAQLATSIGTFDRS